MNPRQAVQCLKTRTGAFLIFAVLCLVGYLLVRGFQPAGFGKKSHRSKTPSPPHRR